MDIPLLPRQLQDQHIGRFRRGFAAEEARHLVGQVGVHHQVGQYTGAVGGHIIGRVVSVRRYAHHRTVIQSQHALGNSLSEGPGADDERIIVIPHRGGKELGGAGGVGVYQDHQGLFDEPRRLHRKGVGRPRAHAPLPVHQIGHSAVAQHMAHRLHHRGGLAARIAPEIHHPAVRLLVLLGDIGLEIGAAVLAEAGALQPADVAVHHFAGDRGEHHFGACHIELRPGAVPLHGDGHPGAGLPPDQRGQRLGAAGLLHRDAVGGHNKIPDLQPGLRGGGIRGHAGDLQTVRGGLHHHTDPHHIAVP